MSEWLVTGLGIVAGLMSTSSFVPQVLKAWKEGDTAAISKRMYLVTVTAFTLWSLYGFMIGNLPIIIFNLLSLALSGTVLFLKIRNDRRDSRASAPAGTESGATRLSSRPRM
jgi:MtN3 and saliva related transmembrane protein